MGVAVLLVAGASDPVFGPDFADSRHWESVPAGTSVSGTFGLLDARDDYRLRLSWHDPNGIQFGTDFVDIVVPLCGSGSPPPPTVVGGTGGLPPTR